MTSKKTRVGILFGGKSAEHEVSLQSAKNVIEAINKDKYDVTLIGIDRSGKWILPNQTEFLLNSNDPKTIMINPSEEKYVALIPGSYGDLSTVPESELESSIDVIFPILHGPYGEDGTVQGLFKLAGIPFVGSGVLGSAVGMDKDVMKRLLRDAGIPIGKFLAFKKRDEINYDYVTAELGTPVFVKPANLGSSVGVSKVVNKNSFEKAVQLAFKFDTKILIEEFIDGREVECAVLGNDEPITSGVGEIIPRHDFYSYDAKYIDVNGAAVEIPAKISEKEAERVRDLALRTFQALSCEGLGRVDCFLRKDGTVVVNEINTMPGFTKISMYPKLWAQSGISYPELIDRLIQLAVDRFDSEKSLQISDTA